MNVSVKRLDIEKDISFRPSGFRTCKRKLARILDLSYDWYRFLIDCCRLYRPLKRYYEIGKTLINLFYNYKERNGSGITKSGIQKQLQYSLGYNIPQIQSGLDRENTIQLFETYCLTSEKSKYRDWVESILHRTSVF